MNTRQRGFWSILLVLTVCMVPSLCPAMGPSPSTCWNTYAYEIEEVHAYTGVEWVKLKPGEKKTPVGWMDADVAGWARVRVAAKSENGRTSPGTIFWHDTLAGFGSGRCVAAEAGQVFHIRLNGLGKPPGASRWTKSKVSLGLHEPSMTLRMTWRRGKVPKAREQMKDFAPLPGDAQALLALRVERWHKEAEAKKAAGRLREVTLRSVLPAGAASIVDGEARVGVQLAKDLYATGLPSESTGDVRAVGRFTGVRGVEGRPTFEVTSWCIVAPLGAIPQRRAFQDAAMTEKLLCSTR